MKQVIIENPVLNSAYDEPKQHFKFTDDGITDEIIEGRRVSAYFVPVPQPRRRGGRGQQLSFNTEWTKDRLKRLTCNDIIEYILKHEEVEDLEKRIEAIERRFNEGR